MSEVTKTIDVTLTFHSSGDNTVSSVIDVAIAFKRHNVEIEYEVDTYDEVITVKTKRVSVVFYPSNKVEVRYYIMYPKYVPDFKVVREVVKTLRKLKYRLSHVHVTVTCDKYLQE